MDETGIRHGADGAARGSADAAVARPAGPAPLAVRALGPDLARGAMLLCIALANSHYFLRGPSVLGGYPQDGSGLDRGVTWLIATFVDGRSFPMFGVLFGYGVARIVARQEGLGPKGVRHLLWRRSAVLVVVGFLHGTLLYVGDILGAYGVLLLFGAWAVRWGDRWLLGVAATFFVLLSLPSDDSLSISDEPPHPTMLPPDLATVFTERPVITLWVATLGSIGFVLPFLVGLWAGRRRILEVPERHLRLLRTVAAAGILTAALGAQPVSLMLARVTSPPGDDVLRLVGPLHDATGYLGGLGYAATAALVAHRLRGRTPGAFTNAVAATGRRSMTCYLAQSVVWTLAFTPFLLDLSGTLTITTTALLATATWLATVALGAWLERTGRRGPFESLVRRVTYR